MTQSAFYRSLERVGRAVASRSFEDRLGVGATRDAVDALLDARRVSSPTDCARGCAFCCHFPVGVTWPEALDLRDRLRLEPELLGALAEAERARRGLDWDERARALLPCPFLDPAGECRIYAARPLPCRAWNSRSRDECERAFDAQRAGRWSQAVPCDPDQVATGLGATAALQEGAPSGASRELVDVLTRLVALPRGTAEHAVADAFGASLPVGG